MKLYICNAFSLSMLDRMDQSGSPAGYVPRSGTPANLVGKARVPCPISDVVGWLGSLPASVEVISAVGHADTAALFTNLLGRSVSANRITVKLGDGDLALIGQLQGPRLPEGANTLPEGATIEWWVV